MWVGYAAAIPLIVCGLGIEGGGGGRRHIAFGIVWNVSTHENFLIRLQFNTVLYDDAFWCWDRNGNYPHLWDIGE